MKPKELFQWRIGEHVVPVLEGQGFRYIRSRTLLKRDRGEFEQRIEFDFSRYNEQDFCEFFTAFSVHSDRYPAWYEEIWGEPMDDPNPSVICACSASVIPGWPARGTGLFSSFQPWQKRKGAHKNYCLRNKKSDLRELAELLEALQGPLMAYMDQLSTWDGAAEHCEKSLHLYPRAVDFHVIAGNEAAARRLVERSLGDDRVLTNPQAEFVIRDLRQRQEKFFGRVTP